MAGPGVTTQSHTHKGSPGGARAGMRQTQRPYLSWALWQLLLWEVTLRDQCNATGYAKADSGRQGSCAECENLGREIQDDKHSQSASPASQRKWIWWWQESTQLPAWCLESNKCFLKTLEDKVQGSFFVLSQLSMVCSKFPINMYSLHLVHLPRPKRRRVHKNGLFFYSSFI